MRSRNYHLMVRLRDQLRASIHDQLCAQLESPGYLNYVRLGDVLYVPLSNKFFLDRSLAAHLHTQLARR